MATTTLRPTHGRGMKLNRWLLVGIAVIVLAIALGVYYESAQGATTTRPITTVPVTTGSITQTVSGNGNITANKSADLDFQTGGVVKQVFVQAGDTVKAGQPLAVLDDSTLQSKVADAQAALTSAQASLAAKEKGSATDAQIASAQAAVNSARQAYNTLVAGPTKTDLASAQAAVASAQAAYVAATKATAAGDATLRSLKATLDEATVTLQQAQAAYDKIAWQSDVGATTQARDLQNATLAYQKALADYNAQLATSGPNAQSSIASAAANLKAAQKTLTDLTPTDASIAAAQATLASAEATLAGYTSPASPTDIAVAQAAVDSAQQALKQAQLNLAQATLTAPFDGVISVVNIVPGSTVSGAAMTLINQDPMHVNLTLSENNVIQVAVGQKVNLTSDALPGWKSTGTVSYIAPASVTTNGVVTYLVQVDFKNTDTHIRTGMTLNVDIVTQQKNNVLVVPNAAILPRGNGYIVQVLGSDGKPKDVPVQQGISDGTHTEITSGLTAGEKIVALPNSATGTNSGGGRPGGFFGFP